jgi:hypothetical protein
MRSLLGVIEPTELLNLMEALDNRLRGGFRMIKTVANRDGDNHLFPIGGFQLPPFHGVSNFLVGLDHVDCDGSI